MTAIKYDDVWGKEISEESQFKLQSHLKCTEMSSRMSTCRADTSSQILRCKFSKAFCNSDLGVVARRDWSTADNSTIHSFTAPIILCKVSSFWWSLAVCSEVCSWTDRIVFWLLSTRVLRTTSVDLFCCVDRSLIFSFRSRAASWLPIANTLAASSIFWAWTLLSLMPSEHVFYAAARLSSFPSRANVVFLLWFRIPNKVFVPVSWIVLWMLVKDASWVFKRSWTFLQVANAKGVILVSIVVSIVCDTRAWISNGSWSVLWLRWSLEHILRCAYPSSLHGCPGQIRRGLNQYLHHLLPQNESYCHHGPADLISKGFDLFWHFLTSRKSIAIYDL